ncbi:MAG: metallophosphoesterase family protein [Roseovarius sp.]
MTLLAIPDIHGQRAALDAVLARADARYGARAKIVFLGDLVDRGPDSRGVIETLIRGLEAGRDWTVLRGNHDQMFLEALEAGAGGGAPEIGARWLSGNIGGAETLASYGVAPPRDAAGWADVARAVPEAHRAFLAGLPLCHETEEQIFVHAGIRPGVPMEAQVAEDLLWIRDLFLFDTRDHGRLVVHGHTPVARPEHRGNRVNLDGGAGWGRELFLARLEGRRAWLVTDEGEEELVP